MRNKPLAAPSSRTRTDHLVGRYIHREFAGDGCSGYRCRNVVCGPQRDPTSVRCCRASRPPKQSRDSGVTSLQATDPNLANAQNLAQSMATAAVSGLLSSPRHQSGRSERHRHHDNLGAVHRLGPPGQSARHHQLAEKANLPTFFSKIWSGNCSQRDRHRDCRSLQSLELANNDADCAEEREAVAGQNADPTHPATDNAAGL